MRGSNSTEESILRQADVWLAGRSIDAPALRELASTRGLDFATAALYQWLRQSSKHGPLIAQLDQPAPATPALDADIVIVPGAFYKERPETGADGRIVVDAARRLGLAATVIPLQSFGTVAENAARIAAWLEQHPLRDVVLVSHSKGATEVRHLLARHDAPALLRRVRAWIDLSGLFLGTPLVGWLRGHRINHWLVRLLFWWHGFSFAALDDIDRPACPPWPGALVAVPHMETIHIVGFPLERDLTTPLARRGYRRLAPLGPNDGTILLEDALALPGRVYPVWGADHYLRPRGRDMSDLIAGVLAYLSRAKSAKRSASAE